jgi:hypothetical protein
MEQTFVLLAEDKCFVGCLWSAGELCPVPAILTQHDTGTLS